MASAVGSGAAVPFWKAAGMTYISYSNICVNLVRNCLQEPFKSEALTHEKAHFSISKWDNGVSQKPSNPLSLSIIGLLFNLFFSIRLVVEKNCEEKDEKLKHKLIIAWFFLFHWIYWFGDSGSFYNAFLDLFGCWEKPRENEI